jgi:hypothetical protein
MRLDSFFRTKKLPNFVFLLFGSLIVLAVFLSYWVYAEYIAPIPPYIRTMDPEFQYFINSLSIFKGQTYFYVDHPGIPVEILGSIILGLTYPFVANSLAAFIAYHLQNPGLFFSLADIFLLVTSLLCAVYFIKTFLSHFPLNFGNFVFAVSLPLMFYAFHPFSFLTLNSWTHGSFAFSFGTLFLLIFFNRITRANADFSLKKLASLGLVAGMLTSVMIYFSAWVLGGMISLLVFHRIKGFSWGQTLVKTLVYALASLFSFMINFLFAWDRLPYFINWVNGILTHQGIYGEGAEGFATFPMLWENFLKLTKFLPQLVFIFGFLGILFVVAFRKRWTVIRENSGLFAFSMGLLIQLVFLFLMVIKHPSLGADRYALPIAATIPVLIMSLMELFYKNDRKMYGILVVIFIEITAYLLFWSGLFSIKYQVEESVIISTTHSATVAIIENYAHSVKRPSDELEVIWTYKTYSPCASLRFGDDSARQVLSKEISDICHHQYYFVPVDDGFLINDAKVKLADIKWNVIVIRGGYLESITSYLSNNNFKQQKIENTENEYGPLFVLTNQSR